MVIDEDEKIEREFSELIREILTDEQFWDYVKSWLDGDFVADMISGVQSDKVSLGR